MSERGLVGPYRGFEHAELAMHVPRSASARCSTTASGWSTRTASTRHSGFSPLLSAEPGGDTGAPETRINPIPRDWYHTDWVADRTIAYLDSLADDDDWFVWMSFPDPHHPWDPPDVGAAPLQLARPRPAGRASGIERGDRTRPRRQAGALARARGGATSSTPKAARVPTVRRTSAHDNIREINAMTHIMNELIDEACGRVLRRIAERGWDADTDVIFTTDHGELQGDYGLVFKGPFHTDSLMRLPMVWRPAPSAGSLPQSSASRSGNSTSRRRSVEIAGVPGARVGRRRAAADGARAPIASGCCASGTRSSPATACTCVRSTATAGCARRTNRRRSANRTGSRSSSPPPACSAAGSGR